MIKAKRNYVSKKPNKAGYINYTEEEHATWKMLYERQLGILHNRACPQFFDGIAALRFNAERIPQLPEINKKLNAFTGWGVQPVTALIGFEKFFTLLANKVTILFSDTLLIPEPTCHYSKF